MLIKKISLLQKKDLWKCLRGQSEWFPLSDFKILLRTLLKVRAQPSTEDFIIESYPNRAYGFINLAGIKSPGFTVSYAIAERAVELIKD